MAKNKSNTPRCKRMKRENRLQSAKHWILKYTGKNLIKGYRKHFGVDHLCAIKELRILGVKLDEHHVAQIMHSLEQFTIARRKRKEAKQSADYPLFDSDEHYYFIAGQSYIQLNFSTAVIASSKEAFSA
jgi:hypothetical protein